jgi:predicted O-methyltransferase YrrM
VKNEIQAIQQLTKKWYFINKLYLAIPSDGFKYKKYRILRPLLKLIYKTYRYFNKPCPWTSPPSISFFKEYLKGNNKVVLEVGSGNSTYFLAPKSKEVISIEHDPSWYAFVKEELKTRGINNVEYHLIEKNEIPESSHQNEFLKTFSNAFPDFEFRKDYLKYYNKITEFPDEKFDLIIIDGRARVECMINAIPKLKKDGLLVLDNSERERYKYIFKYLQDWELANTTNGLTVTSFWKKKQ